MAETLEKQIADERRFAEQQCSEEMSQMYRDIELTLMSLYAQAGSPYGRRKEDAWRWINERYASWLHVTQQEERRRRMEVALATSGDSHIDQELESMLDRGDLMVVKRLDGELAYTLTVLGALRFHTLMCSELLDQVAANREVTKQEYDAFVSLLATSYTFLSGIKSVYREE